MEISSGTIGAVSAAIVVPMLFAFVRKIKSLRHVPDPSKDFNQLSEEYGKWEKLAPFLLIIFGAVIGLALWKSFVLLAELQLSRLGDSEFLVYDPSVALTLPALFLAIFLSAVPIHLLYLRLLGAKRYAEYTEYGNQKSGINSWRLLRYMAYVIIPVCVLFTFLVLDSYLIVTKSRIGVNSFFGVGETEYTFDEVEFLSQVKSYKAPNGNIIYQPYFVIGFKDGAEFNFHRTIHDADIKTQEELVYFLSARSSRAINIEDPYPR